MSYNDYLIDFCLLFVWIFFALRKIKTFSYVIVLLISTFVVLN